MTCPGSVKQLEVVVKQYKSDTSATTSSYDGVCLAAPSLPLPVLALCCALLLLSIRLHNVQECAQADVWQSTEQAVPTVLSSRWGREGGGKVGEGACV